MGIFKHFLLIAVVICYTAITPLMAQDEGIIPETEEPPISSVPQLNMGNPTPPPVIIDESDSSGVSDTEDYDN